MTKRVALLQSNYIPWKGYFDIMGLADEFIIYDEVQYTKNDWRNRNQIKMKDGLHWLTIPIKAGEQFGQSISEAETANHHWQKKHWRTIAQAYSKAPFFKEFGPRIEKLYDSISEESSLSQINLTFLQEIAAILSISTPITSSTDYPGEGERVKRILQICQQANATHYLSGPAARNYIDPAAFEQAGIELEYIAYDGYPPYPQLHGDFEHGVSILDLIFSAGADAPKYMQIGEQTSK
jgi:hypothetical protein